jgi:orotidine-5'-phosphate decarboxylase
MAERLAPHVGGFKVGLELLMGPGPATIAAIRQLGQPVFADAKLHDIPNTVERAARQLGALGARWVSVHAVGGSEMLKAAVAGLNDGARGNRTGVLAIGVLTSFDAPTLASVGIAGSPGKQVARLARLAQAAGAEGMVCSVKELGDVAQVSPALLKVTPGIRRASDPSDTDGDQVRVGTPTEAIRRGADFIVVGRPITRAKDPVAAAKSIIAEISQGKGSSAAEV